MYQVLKKVLNGALCYVIRLSIFPQSYILIICRRKTFLSKIKYKMKVQIISQKKESTMHDGYLKKKSYCAYNRNNTQLRQELK